MILAHQAHMHDVITRVNWETRLALHDEVMNRPSQLSVDTWYEPTGRRIYDAVEVLVHATLFSGEARLESPVRGTSTFANEFSTGGPKDSGGRSLRDLDLNSRLFRYPCSFLVYSAAFNALPKPALDYFYRRLWEVLSGKASDPAFAALTQADREAILSILRQTKADLPRYWKASTL